MSDTIVVCLLSLGAALVFQTVTLIYLAGRFVGRINADNMSFMKACSERHVAVEKRLDHQAEKLDHHLEAHAEGGG